MLNSKNASRTANPHGMLVFLWVRTGFLPSLVAGMFSPWGARRGSRSAGSISKFEPSLVRVLLKEPDLGFRNLQILISSTYTLENEQI